MGVGKKWVLGWKWGNGFREEMGRKWGNGFASFGCVCVCFFLWGKGCVLNVVYYIILWVSFTNWEIKKKVPKLSWAWPTPLAFSTSSPNHPLLSWPKKSSWVSLKSFYVLGMCASKSVGPNYFYIYMCAKYLVSMRIQCKFDVVMVKWASIFMTWSIHNKSLPTFFSNCISFPLVLVFQYHSTRATSTHVWQLIK